MHSVRVQRILNVPVAEAWAALDDFGGVANYHPMVERSPVTPGKTHGLGAGRVCHFHGGGAIQEEITDYTPGQGYTVEIKDAGPFPLKRAVADLSVTPAGTGKTEFVFKMRFTPKFGPVGWLMAQLMMKRQFRRILERVAQGLEDHVRTGQVIGPQGQLLGPAVQRHPAVA